MCSFFVNFSILSYFSMFIISYLSIFTSLSWGPKHQHEVTAVTRKWGLAFFLNAEGILFSWMIKMKNLPPQHGPMFVSPWCKRIQEQETELRRVSTIWYSRWPYRILLKCQYRLEVLTITIFICLLVRNLQRQSWECSRHGQSRDNGTCSGFLWSVPLYL